MKYPHLDPVGAETVDRAWQLAATDLPGAAQLSVRTDDNIASVVRHVEILRRIGKSTQGRDLLHALAPNGVDVPLVALAVANTHWTQGNGTDAVRPYEEAERGYAEIGDSDGVLAARIGLARSARISYSKEKRALLEAALAAGDDSTDVHLLADLDREHSAWDLLVGNHLTATRWRNEPRKCTGA